MYPPEPIGGQDTTSYTVFAKLWTFLWNATNISPDLCREIVNNRILDIQIELLKRKDIVVEVGVVILVMFGRILVCHNTDKSQLTHVYN
jgi:hypothetical protein